MSDAGCAPYRSAGIFPQRKRIGFGLLLCLLMLAMQGCLRHITVVPEPGTVSGVQLPYSVRVELQEFNKDEIASQIDFDLRQALITYLNKRRTFREVVEGPSDVVLTVKAKFSLTSTLVFMYSLSLDASLLTTEKKPVGVYFAEGQATGGQVRITAEADRLPTTQAVNRVLDALFFKIESDHQILLAKLGGQEVTQMATSLPNRQPFKSPSRSSDVDTVPPTKTSTKKNAYAIVVGIEQYQQKLTSADFATHDAEIMGQYLTKALGYAEENVVVLLNDRATRTGVEKYVEGWLPDHVEPGDTVFIYFSGHGAPNPKTGKAYLVPYDGDPAFLEQTGYLLDRLYDRLATLPAKEVIVMLDSCFSGAGGRSVIAKGMRPMGLSVENPVLTRGKIAVLAASSGDQVSSTYEQNSHGLMTYFFLKGLQGEADQNHDSRIELRELFEYLKPKVERTARREFHNEQTPQLLGSPDMLRSGIMLREGNR